LAPGKDRSEPIGRNWKGSTAFKDSDGGGGKGVGKEKKKKKLQPCNSLPETLKKPWKKKTRIRFGGGGKRRGRTSKHQVCIFWGVADAVDVQQRLTIFGEEGNSIQGKKASSTLYRDIKRR